MPQSPRPAELFFRRMSLLTLIRTWPKHGHGEVEVGVGGGGDRRGERRKEHIILSFPFCPAPLITHKWAWRYAEVSRLWPRWLWSRQLECGAVRKSLSFIHTLCSSFPSQGIADGTTGSNLAFGQLGSKCQLLWLFTVTI